ARPASRPPGRPPGPDREERAARGPARPKPPRRQPAPGRVDALFRLHAGVGRASAIYHSRSLMDARRFALIFAVSAVAVAAAATIALLLLGPGGESGGRGVALVGGPFELVDSNGRTVRDEDFRGRLMLVYFGYTWCP